MGALVIGFWIQKGHLCEANAYKRAWQGQAFDRQPERLKRLSGGLVCLDRRQGTAEGCQAGKPYKN